MNEAKHTPGPWAVGRGAAVYGADGYEVADAAQGPHIHASYTGADGHWASTPNAHIERDEDEELANAHLIASAPELLESVNKLLAWIVLLAEALDTEPETVEAAFSNSKTGDSEAVSLKEHLEQARAAITKATGGG